MRLSSFALLVSAAHTLAQSTNASAMHALSTNTQFAFSLAVTLSLANGGGASTGEVLRAASQVEPGDFESYYAAFRSLADAVHASGNGTRSPPARRDAYFRSASYYRAADFYLHGNGSDPRIDETWRLQGADFDAAIALLDVPGRRVDVRSEEGGFDVPVIVYAPAPSRYGCGGRKRPTLLVGTGYDASQEDLWHGLGRAALDRGWNFVTYEGPGQPSVRRSQGLGFRPDWWTVVTPVVDYLVGRDDVDADRLALVGESFGGILAPRAASREKRFAAVLAIDGLENMADAFKAGVGDELTAVFNSGNKALFDGIVNAARANVSVDTTFRWIVGQGLWSFDTDSPFDWLTQLGEFTVEDVVANITCPVFVGSGEDDLSTKGQAEKVAALLGDKAYYHLFKTDTGAGEHCQIGAEGQLAQVAYDWLEGIFESVGARNGSRVG